MNITPQDVEEFHNKTKDNPQPHKLNVGDIIEVHGWVMLEKLPEGKYRIKSITYIYGNAVYWFAKPKGKKTILGHLAKNVDPWITNKNNPDLNKIVKI